MANINSYLHININTFNSIYGAKYIKKMLQNENK